MWSGDNLGIHQIFGFSPNFNSDKCCHFCYADRKDRQNCFRESDIVLRDKLSHEYDCMNLEADSSSNVQSGVYHVSSLSQLKYFSVPANLCPDAMHDILEGCLQYELKLILRNIILREKLLSIGDLNSRIQSFAYGVDSKNKPTSITAEQLSGKQKKLGMNASQAWCFGRYFCLLIGDILQSDSSCLELLTILLDIIDIVFAPNVTISMTYHLEELIYRHHTLFRSLFPDESLIPKQHFLIHYTSKIRKLGPCVQYWCVRFESKHAPAKEFCRTVHNFKNICKSVAWQQQIRLCIDWMAISHPAMILPEIGPGSESLPCILEVPDSVFAEAGVLLYEEMFFPNYVTINGLKYMTGNILFLRYDNDFPVFGLLLYLTHKENRTRFVLREMETQRFVSLLHCFEVNSTDNFVVVDYCDLADWHPLSIHTGFGKHRSCQYIVPRYEVVNRPSFF
jgi:hypothetical protein